jgi:hypothetical protein
MSEPFKYVDELEAIPVPMDENGNIQIKNVVNAIPLFIDCEIEGKSETIFAYIDYQTQNIIIPDTDKISDLVDFKKRVIEFLQWRSNQFDLDVPEIPPEVYQEMQERDNNAGKL